jgi:hypothetical protein
MLHQRGPNLRTASEEQGKHSLRKSTFPHGFLYCTPDQFTGSGMSCVSFYDYRVPSGKRGCCIPTRNRECQWKVTGTEHDYRAERLQHRANIGLGGRLAIGLRAVDPCIDPRSLFGDLRE